jgi:septum site-determining protein MinC
MLESSHSSAVTLPPFDLKGSLFTLTVMYLHQTECDIIASHLAAKVKQAPGFFNSTPVIIDLETLSNPDATVDFVGLYDLLRAQGLVPVGVRNGSADLQSAAVLAGLPLLPEGRAAVATKKSDKGSDEPMPGRRNKILHQQVRSGQQIYVPEGDLIVLGAISPGAEVLADGNIHVYGPLRGRALAGVKGDTETRIFCHSLEAELVSIAGRYKVIEELDAAERGKSVQVYLSKDRLVVESLYQ